MLSFIDLQRRDLHTMKDAAPAYFLFHEIYVTINLLNRKADDAI